MPRIHVETPKKQFHKKNYRPWDLFDEDLSTSNKPYALPSNVTDKSEIQTEHKLSTNRTQTEYKPNTTAHKPNTKLDTQLNTNGDTNWTQTGHKLDTTKTISALVGLQYKILFFLYESCKLSRSNITEPITLEFIATKLNVRLGSIKTTIIRLQSKKFITRVEFKNGRGGWSKYEVPDDVFTQILQYENRHNAHTNRTQTEYKLDTQPNTQPNTTYPSSSSYELLNKTTTSSDRKNIKQKEELSDEWEKIEIEPLSQFGFTNTHLAQIAHQKFLTPDIVQASIYAFAFDLEHNDKAKYLKRDPLNYFMGILRNGKPYAPPANYESPRDRAMRLYLERIQGLNQKRENMLKEAQELAFTEWFDTLGEEEKKELLPANMRQMSNRMMVEGMAREHFFKIIWPEQEQAIMASTATSEAQNESEETTMTT